MSSLVKYMGKAKKAAMDKLLAIRNKLFPRATTGSPGKISVTFKTLSKKSGPKKMKKSTRKALMLVMYKKGKGRRGDIDFEYTVAVYQLGKQLTVSVTISFVYNKHKVVKNKTVHFPAANVCRTRISIRLSPPAQLKNKAVRYIKKVGSKQRLTSQTKKNKIRVTVNLYKIVPQ